MMVISRTVLRGLPAPAKVAERGGLELPRRAVSIIFAWAQQMIVGDDLAQRLVEHPTKGLTVELQRWLDPQSQTQ
jgi:hypothetical protein